MAWALLVLLTATMVWQYLLWPLQNPAVDYSKHWYAAVYILTGENIYEGHNEHLFYYSHFAALIYAFLAFVTIETGLVIWRWINFALFFSSLLLLSHFTLRGVARTMGDHPILDSARRWMSFYPFVIGLFLLADFHPARTSFNSGNIDPLIVLFLSLFTISALRERDDWAGLFLALAFLIKFAMVFLIFPFIFLVRWKLVASFSICLGAYYIIVLITGHFWDELVLYRDILPEVAYVWQHISLSVHRIIAMTLGEGVTTDPDAFRRVVFLTTLTIFAIYLTTLTVFRFYRKSSPEVMMLIGYCFMMLHNPLLEFIHFLWFIPALFLVVRLFITGKIGIGGGFAAVIGWILLSKTLFFTTLAGQSVYAKAGLLYTTIILMLVVSWVASEPREDKRAPELP